MKLSTSATLLSAASVALANTITPAENAELQVVLADVNDNLGNYMNLLTVSGFTLPDNIIDIYIGMGTDPVSYTTLFTELDMGQISAMLTWLPWYSSLEPKISAAMAPFQTTSTSTTTSITTSTAQTPKTVAKTTTTPVAAASSAPAAVSSIAPIFSNSTTMAPFQTTSTSTTTSITTSTAQTPKTVAKTTTTASVALANTITPAENAELQVVLADVNDNLGNYMNLLTVSGFSLPDNIVNVYMGMGADPVSYTTLFTELDMGQISAMLTWLPWYSSLEPKISAAMAPFQTTSTSTTTSITTSTAQTPKTVAKTTISAAMAPFQTTSTSTTTSITTSTAQTPKTVAKTTTTASVALANTITPAENAELQVVLADVNDNLGNYMNLLTVSGFSLPDNIVNVYMGMGADPVSYTTLFTELDMGQISAMLTWLPWYSSLEPKISAAMAPFQTTSTSTTTSITTSTAQTPKTVAKTTTTPVAAASSAPAAVSSIAPIFSNSNTTAAAGGVSVTTAITKITSTETSTICTEAKCQGAKTVIAASSAPAAVSSIAPIFSNSNTTAAAGGVSVTTAITKITSTETSTICTEAKCQGAKTVIATETNLFTNTTTYCSSTIITESVATAYKKATETATKTVCTECLEGKTLIATETNVKTGTTTINSCPSESTEAAVKPTSSNEGTSTLKTTVTVKSKSSAAPSTVAQVSTAQTSSQQVINQQTENGAAKAVAGLGAGFLAAAALLL
ncbi:hypothetical protein NCAS_0E02110 [Naumovozyma castellii]|uniref:Uncharacterized protein n=1 Tax=Naumovozyma castellii TaxID=27288 RepID=G0VFL4_NAUCA|nr:hypothetical protein NCAS_0E02110 [Naumovozyma castellii CBS 4309]CCC70281.1 hypothetical protein NCAS_0E02110 [Naumovozyma castellii CBS 4309]